MYHILFIFCLLLFSVPLFAQEIVWEQAYGTIGDEKAWDMEKTPDGGYILLGSQGPKTYLVKTDFNGDTLWTRTYDEFGISISLCVTGDGNYILGGWGITKVLKSGEVAWTTNYPEFPNLSEIATIKETSDGKYVAIARMVGTSNQIWRLDGNGQLFWTKDSIERYADIEVEEGFFVVSQAAPYVSLTKFTNVNELIFEKKYEELVDLRRSKVIKAQSHEYVVAANTNSWGNVFIMKLDELGDSLWTNTISEIVNVFVVTIEQSSDQGYFLTGTASQFGTDIYFLKLNDYGKKEWSSALNRFNLDEDVYNGFIECDSSVVVFGDAENGPIGGDDLLFIKVKPSGVQGICHEIPCIDISHESIWLHPNPASNVIAISSQQTMTGTIEIFDISGKMHNLFSVTESPCLNVQVSHLQPGLYFIKFKNSLNNHFQTLKFIKL
jgi:hypothetical protein